MRVVITGGTGFIGRRIALRLLERGALAGPDGRDVAIDELVLFASSLAVYGGDLPPKVSEATPLTPQTSYGAQKAIGELLVNDYSRKGYIDGRALRLPTIIV